MLEEAVVLVSDHMSSAEHPSDLPRLRAVLGGLKQETPYRPRLPFYRQGDEKPHDLLRDIS